MTSKIQKRLVVLASGEGSTFAAISEACASGQLPAELVGLIVSRDHVGAIDKAQAAGVACIVVDPKAFKDRGTWDKTLTETVRRLDPDFVALAGYTQLLGERFLKSFSGRVINTHPSLLPKFGGKGMYGMKVHAAVIAAGESETGLTVHRVTADYDEGPVVAQHRVPVEKGDTPESLAARVKAVEKVFYVEVLKKLLSD